MENSLEPPKDGKGRPAQRTAPGGPAEKEESVPSTQEDRPPAAEESAAPEPQAASVPAPEALQAAAQSEPEAPEDAPAFADAVYAPDIAEVPDTPEAPDAAGAADNETGDSAQAAQQSEAVSGPAAREAETAATVEAVLFAADSPLPAAKVAQIARLGLKAVRAAIGALNDRYHQVGAAFRIEEIAGGFQMLTLGQYRDVLERLHSARSESRLTQAALETLAVVAYRQPVLRADIESIRGVACGEVLRGLMEKQLIHIAGRAQILGRPLLYGTTRRFLEHFGLANLEDLPKAEELRAPAQKAATEAPAAPESPVAPETQAAPETQTAPATPDTATAASPAAQEQTAPIVAPPDGQYISESQPAQAQPPSVIA